MHHRSLARHGSFFVLICLALLAVSAVSQSDIFDDGFENLPPEIISIPETVAYVGIFYWYHVVATDSEGDVLAYELLTAPTDMHFSVNYEERDWISWVPQATGEYDVTIRVTDGMGGESTQAWVITVDNKPCVQFGGACTQSSDCCQDLIALRCNQEMFTCCVDLFGSCTQSSDCCSDKNLLCDTASNTCCGGVGASCSSSGECCPGMTCYNDGYLSTCQWVQ